MCVCVLGCIIAFFMIKKMNTSSSLMKDKFVSIVFLSVQNIAFFKAIYFIPQKKKPVVLTEHTSKCFIKAHQDGEIRI